MMCYDGKRVGRIFFMGEEIEYEYINVSDELREWLKFLLLSSQGFLFNADGEGVRDLDVDSNFKQWSIIK